ncbi:MAG: biotin transporter BioY [Lachnospiraceae bacterium]|jgi:biotin transport system substrate-specific component|nr:biotin transporter BioY [Lachnospiraceae bacterium]
MNSKSITKSQNHLRELCQIGVFTAVIAVMAQISIPMPSNVPFTLQTFAIALAGVVLGPRNGAACATLYVLLAAIGVPVLAGFSGGLGMVFGVTGGFILSFPLLALGAGLGARSGKVIGTVAGVTSGVIVNYLCGMIMYSFLTKSSLATAFIACVLPFILPDILKVIAVILVGKKLRSALMKSGVLKPWTLI